MVKAIGRKTLTLVILLIQSSSFAIGGVAFVSYLRAGSGPHFASILSCHPVIEFMIRVERRHLGCKVVPIC